MIFSLHLIEEVKSSLPKKLYTDIFRETLAASGYQTESGFRIHGKKVTLNAVAISEKKIQELNRTYRGLDEATDILSFGEDVKAQEGEKEQFLGELFFSPEFIRKQAESDDGPYRQAVIYIFSHGILHLLGYDHSEAMFTHQDHVTEKLFLPNAHQKKTKN